MEIILFQATNIIPLGISTRELEHFGCIGITTPPTPTCPKSICPSLSYSLKRHYQWILPSDHPLANLFLNFEP